MKSPILPLAFILLLPAMLFAASDGAWIQRVPDSERAITNSLVKQPKSAFAGKQLFDENCAKCHGSDAMGLRNRPSLRSDRIRHAKDGEIFWMLRNGNPYKGMPPWTSLSEQQRWLVIAYIRSLPPAPGVK